MSESVDLNDFLRHGAHVDAEGNTVIGPQTREVLGRTAVSWWPGFGPSVEVWADEVNALEQDLVTYGNVYLALDALTSVCTRIDPVHIRPIDEPA